MTESGTPTPSEFSFGSFRLLRDQRLLLDGETPVRLGARAFEILATLVERPGVVVTKDELFARVWPKQFVEEGNLKFHVATLRKALRDGQGARYISNVPGRGYCFVAPVESLGAKVPAVVAANPATELRRLPAALRHIVGRSDVIVLLATRLPEHRFITVVGPGGIGKTTVAVAVADALVAAFHDGVGFVDLAPLTDPSLIASAVAGALGLTVHAADATQGLVSLLRDKHVLIVLDNCEHLIEPIAALAEAIFRDAPKAHILATSREPLRADGERVHRLAPLATPPASLDLTAAQALAFPAVQLFVERAAASQDTFELSDEDAPSVAELCRGLDGIALAIEIAAGRVDTFGIAELASGLDNRLRLLIRGRRTSLSRHQTLGATLDWSYQLLSEAERAILRGLAIFAGAFTLHSACAVLQRDDVTRTDVLESIANLVAKSLVSLSVEKGHFLLSAARNDTRLRVDQTGGEGREG